MGRPRKNKDPQPAPEPQRFKGITDFVTVEPKDKVQLAVDSLYRDPRTIAFFCPSAAGYSIAFGNTFIRFAKNEYHTRDPRELELLLRYQKYGTHIHCLDGEVRRILSSDPAPAAPRSGPGCRDLEDRYRQLCDTPSDINEHLPVLREYAARAATVFEFGVRHAVSTIALLSGGPKRLVSVDINPDSEKWFFPLRQLAPDTEMFFIPKSSAEIPQADCDLLFIDSEHSYAHLKKELELHAPGVRKWIILHDTEAWGDHDEPPGKGPGLKPAVLEFLGRGGWRVERHLKNNNGLMVLARINETDR